MAILETTPGLLEAFKGEMTPKFLATRDLEGVPNVVPVVSLRPADDLPDLVFFGNFLLRKSIENLKRDARVGILVVTPELQGWILRGDFLEFQRAGKYVDQQMGGSLLRYNAYTGIRNAGLIRVRELVAPFRISRGRVMTEYMRARVAALTGGHAAEGEIRLPLPIRREFARMVAVKVLAWVGEGGYPIVVPALSLQPSGGQRLVCVKGGDLPQPPADARVATNILTFEAISYQAKGRWIDRGKTGAVQVQEVYAGGPPLPGGRIA